MNGTVLADGDIAATQIVAVVYNATGPKFQMLSQVANVAAGGAALTVREEDGTPIDTAVTIIRVPNGGLTDNGVGDVSLGYAGIAIANTFAALQTFSAGLRL